MAHRRSADFASEPMFMPASTLWTEFIPKRRLGEGNCGEVWEVQNVTTGELAACKILKKSDNPAEKVRRETLSMNHVTGHENIISLLAVYEDDKMYYLLLELGTAGCLLSRINEKRGLGEDESRHFFRDIVRAIKHCHDNNIVHRDVKPDNIVLCHVTDSEPPSPPASPASSRSSFSSLSTSSSDASYDLTAKLGDFGLAVPLKPGRKIRNYAGSFPYEAPEVTVEDPCYNHTADVWSLGVLLYVMLFTKMPPGDLPINGLPSNSRLPNGGKGVSADAVDLLRSCLQISPKDRPTPAAILSSRWLTSDLPSPPASPTLLGKDEQRAEKKWGWGFRI